MFGNNEYLNIYSFKFIIAKLLSESVSLGDLFECIYIFISFGGFAVLCMDFLPHKLFNLRVFSFPQKLGNIFLKMGAGLPSFSLCCSFSFSSWKKLNNTAHMYNTAQTITGFSRQIQQISVLIK